MLAAYAHTVDPDHPLDALTVGDIEEPPAPDGWRRVRVRAAALNHHDLWSLKGVGLTADQCPMILGTDAAGVADDGSDVIVYPVIADGDLEDETFDAKRSLLSERHPGTLAETVAVPARNLVPKPKGWSLSEAACLPTAYLTAWRMLTTRGRLPKGGAVLVQGTGGGVASAAIALAAAMGARVYAVGRAPERRERASALGAEVVAPGARLPERVDVVVDPVGGDTLTHSIKSLKPGGRLVTCGATAGHQPRIDLTHVFFRQLEILGSTMGTRDELLDLIAFCDAEGVRPIVDSTFHLDQARDALRHLDSGLAFGKVVLQTS